MLKRFVVESMFEELLATPTEDRIVALKQARIAGQAFGQGDTAVFAAVHNAIFEEMKTNIRAVTVGTARHLPTINELISAFSSGYYDEQRVPDHSKHNRLVAIVGSTGRDVLLQASPCLVRLDGFGLTEIDVLNAVFVELLKMREAAVISLGRIPSRWPGFLGRWVTSRRQALLHRAYLSAVPLEDFNRAMVSVAVACQARSLTTTGNEHRTLQIQAARLQSAAHECGC